MRWLWFEEKMMLNAGLLRARGRWLLVAGVLAILAAVAPPARPARAAVPGSGFAIVTLGDSFIAGEGVRWNGNEGDGSDSWMADRSSHSTWFGHVSDPPAIYGSSWWDPTRWSTDPQADTGCHRGEPSEANSTGLAATITFNIACSGAGTAALTPGGPGYKGEISQVDQLRGIASANPVRLIVLSIGGNDLGFGDIVAACIANFIAFGPTCHAAQQTAVDNAMQTAMGNLVTAIEEIQGAMAADGYQPGDYRLMVQDYPDILPAESSLVVPGLQSQYGCPIYPDDIDWAHNSLIPEIDANVRATVHGTGAQFVDLQDLFSGHELCSTQTERVQAGVVSTMAEMEWVREVNNVAPPPAGDPGWQHESVHPNAYGHQAMATCIGLVYQSDPAYDYTCTGSAHSAAVNALPITPPPVSGGVALRPDGRSGYAVDGYGNVTAFGGAPPASFSGTWGGWNRVRGIALAPNGTSGYLLDGSGGLWPFGGAGGLSGGPYWPGADIARALVLDPDGLGGQILDGWGGIHPFGNAPALGGGPYWNGWDIARGLALDPDGQGGQVLDGWGGLHPFGNATAVSGGPYWYGRDIARGVALLGNGSSGYVLDGWGGLHPFGGAPAAFTPPLNYHSGLDTARGLAVVPCGGNSGVRAAVMTLQARVAAVQTAVAGSCSGDLYDTTRHANSWDPFSYVFGQAGSPGPARAVAAAPGLNGDVQFAVVTTSGDLYQTIHHANGSWDRFGYVYGQTGNPGRAIAVAAAPGLNGDVQFAVVTTTGDLYHTIRHANGTWDPFGSVYGQAGNPGPATAVAAAAGLNGDVQFAVVVNGALYHTIRHPYGWDPFRNVYDQTGSPGPATAVAAAPGLNGDVQFAVVVNGALYHTIRHPYGWDPFGYVYGQTGNPGPATAVAAAPGLNGDVQFAVVVNGALYHTTRHPYGWDPFRNVYDQTGSPGAAATVGAAPGLNGDVQFAITTAG